MVTGEEEAAADGVDGDQNESLDYYYYYYYCIPGQVHQFIRSTTSQLWDPHYTLPGCVIKSHRFATLELFYFTVDSKYNFHKITKCSSSVCLLCSKVFSTFLHTFSQSIRATTVQWKTYRGCSYYYEASRRITTSPLRPFWVICEFAVIPQETEIKRLHT